MSILKTVASKPSVCSFAITASLAVYIQQTEEQYSLPNLGSLDPTHCKNASFCGTFPSDGRNT